jgi:hypothetical protein
VYNTTMTTCGALAWGLCEMAVEAGYISSWLAILMIAISAWIVGHYGSRAVARFLHVKR